jgi:hypothetical protein
MLVDLKEIADEMTPTGRSSIPEDLTTDSPLCGDMSQISVAQANPATCPSREGSVADQGPISSPSIEPDSTSTPSTLAKLTLTCPSEDKGDVLKAVEI